jgi:hypothetical protein
MVGSKGRFLLLGSQLVVGLLGVLCRITSGAEAAKKSTNLNSGGCNFCQQKPY